MRRVASALLVALLLLTACSGGDPDADGSEASERAREIEDLPPVRGEIEIDVEPLALDALPEAPEPGTGVAVVGERSYTFVVTFCDEAAAIGTGSGERVEVAWDVRDDGDHRVNVRTKDGDNWVRGGPAEADWDAATGTLRFAGAFVPFRATDGRDAQPGGVVLVCPDGGVGEATEAQGATEGATEAETETQAEEGE